MKNKNKKIFFSSLIFIIAAAAVMTIAQTSYAADSTTGATASNTLAQLNKNGKFGKISGHLNRNTNQATQAARQAERIKKQEAVKATLKTGDYNAWVQAVGTSSPMLTKINKDNFAKFVQAHELKWQADAIMTELGINPGEGRGMMNGEGRGMMGGAHLNNSVTK